MDTVLTPTKKNLEPNHDIKSCLLYRQIFAVKRKWKVTQREGLEFLCDHHRIKLLSWKRWRKTTCLVSTDHTRNHSML